MSFEAKKSERKNQVKYEALQAERASIVKRVQNWMSDADALLVATSDNSKKTEVGAEKTAMTDAIKQALGI